MPTTYAADLRDALKAIGDAQVTATPTLLRAFWRYRPGGIGETPAGYIAAINERVRHTQGLRLREVEATVTIVDTFPTENIPDDPMDQLRDAFLDRLTDAVSQIAGGGNVLGDTITITDGEIEQPGPNGVVIYRGLSFTVSGSIQEGRI